MGSENEKVGYGLERDVVIGRINLGELRASEKGFQRSCFLKPHLFLKCNHMYFGNEILFQIKMKSYVMGRVSSPPPLKFGTKAEIP